MKLKLIFLIIFCVAILHSCDKERESIFPVENQDSPLLTKEIYSDELFNQYTYSNENLLKERKSKWAYTVYHYNENHQLVTYDFYYDSRIFSSDWATAQAAMNRTDWVTPENTELTGTGKYFYSKNGQLEKIQVTNLSSGTNFLTTFDYDANGRIAKKTFRDNNQAESFIEYAYDERGNLIRETRYYLSNGASQKSSTTEYLYDNQKNPYKAFQRLLLPGENTNENNIVKQTVTFYEDIPGVDKVQVAESAYQYNQQGYPVSKGVVHYEYQ